MECYTISLDTPARRVFVSHARDPHRPETTRPDNCGYVPSNAAGAAPDKKAGVVAITLFDLRRRGKVGRVLLADVDGRRIAPARALMAEKIGREYVDMDMTLETWPKDETASFDLGAPAAAMDTLLPGDAVIVFTPDPTHFSLASAAMSRGLHVLVAKPVVKILSEHLALEKLARERSVIAAVEYHNRWDPIYSDARERARKLGPFSFFSAMMTQRRVQLDTFASWAGKSSDISYYLNSHHIDILSWMVEGRARPERVVAAASSGVADAQLGRPCEDTITLMTTFRNADGSSGHANTTASWVAPTADCHTQQGFHYMGHGGEIRADQAHRGYQFSADAAAGGTGALASLNPLYMRYVPDSRGYFAGQIGYGYKSIEAFVDAAAAVSMGVPLATAQAGLATVETTLKTTAILEAGRRSLDAGGKAVKIIYADSSGDVDVDAHPVGFEIIS